MLTAGVGWTSFLRRHRQFDGFRPQVGPHDSGKRIGQKLLTAHSWTADCISEFQGGEVNLGSGGRIEVLNPDCIYIKCYKMLLNLTDLHILCCCNVAISITPGWHLPKYTHFENMMLCWGAGSLHNLKLVCANTVVWLLVEHWASWRPQLVGLSSPDRGHLVFHQGSY